MDDGNQPYDIRILLREVQSMKAEISMDCVTYVHLTNRPVQLRKGDKLEVLEEVTDLMSKVRLLEGEGKGKVFSIDNLFISFK